MDAVMQHYENYDEDGRLMRDQAQPMALGKVPVEGKNNNVKSKHVGISFRV